ncbi:fungal-specific transcription factor domain-containing protein [Plectosphaerella cucumerina]|uniref:Fungal-specific transcription factor domain-containing protein n=1 Tax=Plectosphaerella cucumerina TaxID=40658 RepID=A0A8K0TWA9_9PEZI|nr:fungal-specific transcription factor domain-containing protein [Plectosphaerella cucumerina]
MTSSRAGSSTAGTSPETRDDGTETGLHVDYRPIRRINRACHACRRKKSRCTGGHPCRSCRRLGETCEYPAAVTRVQRPLEDDVLPETASSLPGPTPAPTSDRLDALESRLDIISRQLGQLTELTRQLCAAREPAVQDSQPSIYPSGPSTNPNPLNDPFHPQHWAVKLDNLVPPPVLRAVFRDYFLHAHNQPYSFFHEATFWTRLDAGLLPDHLLLAVLSHAIRFSTDPFFGERARPTSVLFANMAWKAIVYLYFQERADADLAAVQTMTLLSMYDFTAGHDRHDSAWVKIGVAVRMAQDLCLMMEDTTGTLTTTDAEERRRVFWSVYMLDRLASCARARPPAVLEASCHLSLPCEERIWRAGLPSPGYRIDDVITRGGLPGDQHPGFPALVMAMTSIVGRCTQCMFQGPGGRPRQAPWDQASDYATICSELLTCEGTVLPLTAMVSTRPLLGHLSFLTSSSS